MAINKKREVVRVIPTSPDDECLKGIQLENLGSQAFSEKTGLAIIASDANYLRFHKEHTPDYAGEIHDPFYPENADGFWIMMRGRYADNRQLTPFEILAEREREEEEAQDERDYRDRVMASNPIQ
jgi:hypothetical protein